MCKTLQNTASMKTTLAIGLLNCILHILKQYKQHGRKAKIAANYTAEDKPEKWIKYLHLDSEVVFIICTRGMPSGGSRDFAFVAIY